MAVDPSPPGVPANVIPAPLTFVSDKPDPNLSDRCPPKPEEMVKPSLTGRKYYVITFGRKVGITSLSYVISLVLEMFSQFYDRSAAMDYQRGVSGAASCSFLVWEDALAYYAASYDGGHVHISNATTKRSVRGTTRVLLPGGPQNPIFIPSATSTPTRPESKGQNPPVTPIRPTGNLGSNHNPIFVSSALSTPQGPRIFYGPVKAPASHVLNQVPPSSDPSTPSGRRLIAISQALEEVNRTSAPGPSQQPTAPAPSQQPMAPAPSQISRKNKQRFIATNEEDDDENTITGYFGTQGTAPGPSRGRR